MRLYYVLACIIFGSMMIKSSNGYTVFNFTTPTNTLEGWVESSDTIRTLGMSKAALSIQKTPVFQRVVFFSLLIPQPDGACFAGMRTPVKWDLSNYKALRVRCRGHGQNSHYKIVLRHENALVEEVGYEQYFEVPMAKGAFDPFGDIVLDLDNFKPYFRGKEVDDKPLNRAQITLFSIQMYGGVYRPIKQSGVSALDIESIVAI